MGKRLTMEQKKEKMVADMINQMFEIANHQVTYNDIKDRKDNWFQQWTMTQSQFDEWTKWGIKYLKKHFKFSPIYAERQMAMIGLMWGLKFEENGV